MKTRTNRLIALTALTALIVAGTNFDGKAQEIDGKRGKESKSEGTVGREFEFNRQKDHLRDDQKDVRVRTYSDEKRYGAANENDERRRNNQFRREEEVKRYNKYDRNKRDDWNQSRKPDNNRHFDLNFGSNNHGSDYYYHRDYGKTYRRFHTNPLVFRHNHGRYYYYDNNFCEYRDGIGYVVIDVPLNTIFSALPFHLNRIRIHGNIFYQYNNLYFVMDNHGYRLVQSPNRKHFSARF